MSLNYLLPSIRFARSGSYGRIGAIRRILSASDFFQFFKDTSAIHPKLRAEKDKGIDVGSILHISGHRNESFEEPFQGRGLLCS